MDIVANKSSRANWRLLTALMVPIAAGSLWLFWPDSERETDRARANPPGWTRVEMNTDKLCAPGGDAAIRKKLLPATEVPPLIRLSDHMPDESPVAGFFPNGEGSLVPQETRPWMKSVLSNYSSEGYSGQFSSRDTRRAFSVMAFELPSSRIALQATSEIFHSLACDEGADAYEVAEDEGVVLGIRPGDVASIMWVHGDQIVVIHHSLFERPESEEAVALEVARGVRSLNPEAIQPFLHQATTASLEPDVDVPCDGNEPSGMPPARVRNGDADFYPGSLGELVTSFHPGQFDERGFHGPVTFAQLAASRPDSWRPLLKHLQLGAGFIREWWAGGSVARIELFEFASHKQAVYFDDVAVRASCSIAEGTFLVPGVAGATGLVIPQSNGMVNEQVSFVRGARRYVAAIYLPPGYHDRGRTLRYATETARVAG